MSKKWSNEIVSHVKSKTGVQLKYQGTLGNGHLEFTIGDGKRVTTSKSPSGNKKNILNNIAKDVRYKVAGHYN